MRPIYTTLYRALPIALQSLACTADGYRRYRSSYTSYFYETLEKWEARVNDPIELQRERQWAMLKDLIETAREHIPYYRFLPPIVETSNPAESVEKTLANIAPLDKEVYRARSHDFVARNLPRHRLLHRSTSGTTGTALSVWHTPERIAEGRAARWRQLRSCGVEVNDQFINFTGQVIVPLGQQTPPFWRRDHYSGMTLFSMYHLSPSNLPYYIDEIHKTQATYIHGYPSVLHLVSRAMVEADRCIAPGQLKGVFTHSESVLAFQRETIERAFNTSVRDYYHSTEEAVSMTACEEKRLHVDMEYGIVEVDPVEETEEYVRGPLLVTGLGSVSTPFIRYRIGDVGTRCKTPCPCGRPGDVFLDIDGRIEDYVVTPDGRMVGRLDHIFKEQYQIEEAQIVQDDPESIDILIVARGGLDERGRRSLEREVHSRLGPRIRTNIRLVETIMREPNGKFRAVKSSVAGIDS
jgi:phenylacetate-CoA ligase